MSTTPKTKLTELSSTAANQAPVVNADWAIIDQLLDGTVKDKDLATPPGSPEDGDAYIVASSPTGVWSGKTNQIAYYRASAGAWQFIVPRAGWTLRVADELDTNAVPKEYGYTGSAWLLSGAGFSGGTISSALNEAPLVTLASAATVNISAAAANTINISGTTTITAFDSIASGAKRVLVFQGALTLTHNSTSLILPTATNVITAAGDIAEFVSLGSGNWRCTNYQRADGTPLAGSGGSFTGGTLTSALNEAPAATLASAATVNIGAAAANTVKVTGTTTITAFDSIADGAVRKVEFQGALTLTHNATSLILPTGANIATAAGDVAEFRSLGSGNWKCTGYMRANGQALAGGGGGGLTNLAEAKNTSDPNATVPVVSLSVSITETNGDIAIIAKGTGALLAQIPTNNNIGGNKRGEYATDWQRVRSSSNQVASGNWSVVCGGQNNRVDGSSAVVVGGSGNTANGAGSFIGGGDTSTVTNSYAAIAGGRKNNIFASFGFIGGGQNNSIENGTYGAVAGGNGNIIRGSNDYQTIGGGRLNTCQGNSSTICGGENNDTSGHYSTVLGGLYGSDRGTYGAEVRASGRFSASGDAQRRRVLLRAATADATSTALTSDGAAASTANRLTLPNNSTFAFHGQLVARSGNTDQARFSLDGLITRGANEAATALVGTPTVTATHASTGASGWTVTVTADTTNGLLNIAVTGAAATNIKWVADIETVEVVG